MKHYYLLSIILLMIGLAYLLYESQNFGSFIGFLNRIVTIF